VENLFDNNRKAEDFCKENSIVTLVEDYVIHCLNSSKSESETEKEKKKKEKSRFPNFAGFCRYYGFTQKDMKKIHENYPEQYDALCMVFEDEAFNSELSPTVLTAYLKHRLGYSDKKQTESGVWDDGEISLVFDHDIEDAGI